MKDEITYKVLMYGHHYINDSTLNTVLETTTKPNLMHESVTKGGLIKKSLMLENIEGESWKKFRKNLLHCKLVKCKLKLL